MGKYDTGTTHGSTLAEEAAPMRCWLTRYFRRRIRNEAEVEDMVQEVFARIVARDSEEPIEHLGGYVLKIASSVLIDQSRRGSSKLSALHVAFDSELHGEDEIDPERVLGGRQDLRAVTEALLSLPERTRTIFILRRLEARKHQEIARQLGISVSAVEKHMLRAIQHLAQTLEKRHAS
jgi:RNA polymerase sigma factor (sigma-70 family)